MDDVIQLICAEYAKNEYGVDRPSESCREVFAQVSSVTRSEFFEGGRNGLNPELRFVIFAGDYNGEQTLEHAGRRYGIYRSYFIPGSDYVELYAERKGGLNGGNP